MRIFELDIVCESATCMYMRKQMLYLKSRIIEVFAYQKYGAVGGCLEILDHSDLLVIESQ